MAATSGTRPRRKQASYGKTSRNSVLGCRSIVSNASTSEDGNSSHFFEENLSSGIRNDGFAITGSLRGHCYPMAENQPNLIAERGVEEESLPNKTSSKNLSQMRSERGGSLYDVPSSADEQDYTLRSDPAKKKRKRCKIRTGDGSGIVYDHDNLQQHIAAEINQHNHIPPHPSILPLTRHRTPTRVHAKNSDLTSRVAARESIGVPRESEAAFLSSGDLWRTNTRTSVEHGNISKLARSFPARKISDSRSQIANAGLPLVRPATPPQVTRSTIRGLITPRQQAPQYLPADLEEFLSASDIGIRSLQIAHLPQSSTQTHTLKDGYSQSGGACPAVLKSLRTKLVDKLHRTHDCPNPAIEYSPEDERLGIKHSIFHVAQPHDAQYRGNMIEDISLGSDSQSFGKKKQDATPTNIPKPVASIHGGSLKVTYARQRSYLTEDEVNETAMFSIPSTLDFTSDLSLSNQPKIKIASKAQPSRHRYLEIEDSEDGQSGAIRSIHELREAGGNARLAGEMEAILEDINNISSMPLSLQRSSLLELAMKLKKSSFCRSFIDRGLESRLLAYIGFCPDTIVNMLLMVSFIYILAEPCLQHTLDLINNQRTVEYLGGYLNNTDELVLTASNRKSNISKARQLDILNLCESLIGSSAWRSGRRLHITARTLSLQCLEYLVQHVREAGCTSDTLPESTTTALVDMMVPCMPHSLPDPPPSTIAEFLLAISILESTTASRAATNSVESVWTSESTAKMAYLLPVIQTWPGEGIKRLRTLALRLSLNLTNNNLSSCEAFSKPEMVNATMKTILSSFHHLSSKLPENNQMEVLDNLVVALGLLINLAEWSEIARELFVTTRIDRNTSLDALVHLFKANSAKVSEVLSILDQL